MPENVVAIPDIGEAVKDATAIVFVMPHQCESYSQFPFLLLESKTTKAAGTIMK